MTIPTITTVSVAPGSHVVDHREIELFEQINAYRQRRGRQRWRWSTQLAAAARAHSAAMAHEDFFDHYDRHGRTPGDRIHAAGYGIALVTGENIAMGTTSATATLAAWIQSPTHHALLLDRGPTEAGIGLAAIGSYLYWTLDCARSLTTNGCVPDT